MVRALRALDCIRLQLNRDVMQPGAGSTQAKAFGGVVFMKRKHLPQRLSEVEAHQLLARAAELDARFGETVTTEQLSTAALEAGISGEAIEQAAAELAAGQLGSPARGAVIRTSIVTVGRLAVAAGLTWWLLVDASRPLAQGLALGFAVYGAYAALGLLSRRFRRGLRAATDLTPGTPQDGAAESTEVHKSMSVRLFAALDASPGAA
jgi:hypothetical protein